MRLIAAIILALLFLRNAKVLHELKYVHFDRPELFTEGHIWMLWCKSAGWLVLLLGMLAVLGLKLKDRIIVPTMLATAIALWSLTITISPEHRDWGEQWFGLALCGVPISVAVTMAVVWLADGRRSGNAQQDDGPGA